MDILDFVIMYVYRTFCSSFKMESKGAAVLTVGFGFLWVCMLCWLQTSSSNIFLHDCVQRKENDTKIYKYTHTYIYTHTKKRYDLG